MKTLPILLSLAGLAGLASRTCAQSPPVFVLTSASSVELGDSAGGAAKKDDLYRSAQRDLDAGRWAAAIDKFGQVAKKGGSDADGALYWRAYAEHKAGHSQQALATIRRLSGAYPKSAWIDDARALSVEIRGDSTPTPPGPRTKDSADEDEELKLYALNGLLASDPDRALPVLQKFLQGNHSQRLKEQALFVLSQCDAPEAHSTLVAAARGTAHPELQRKAIEYLGVAGGAHNVKALEEIYRGSGKPEVRRAVLDSFLVAEERGKLLAVAQDAKDPLQREAIHLLGALEAKAELRQIYAAGSREARLAALDAMGVAEDAEGLIDAARRETDPGLRAQAIQGLGVGGGAKGAEALRSMYAGSSDPSLRRAVIDALFVQDNAHALIDIFRAEKDREMRREIVEKLSQMDSEEAAGFLEKIYSN